MSYDIERKTIYVRSNDGLFLDDPDMRINPGKLTIVAESTGDFQIVEEETDAEGIIHRRGVWLTKQAFEAMKAASRPEAKIGEVK